MSEYVVFKNAFLIDGTGREPTEGVTLIVSGDKVEDIYPNPPGAAVSRGRVFDLQGKTLMPGLIDAHVHPGNVEWHLNQTAKLPPAVYVHRVSRTLETDLKLGFTTLRDAAGLDSGFREAIEQGMIRGPRLLLSITPITQREAGLKPEARNSLGIFPEVCSGPDEMGRAVLRTLKGALIKSRCLPMEKWYPSPGSTGPHRGKKNSPSMSWLPPWRRPPQPAVT